MKKYILLLAFVVFAGGALVSSKGNERVYRQPNDDDRRSTKPHVLDFGAWHKKACAIDETAELNGDTIVPIPLPWPIQTGDTIWRPIDYIDPYNPALGCIPQQITTPCMKGEGDTIREVVDTIPQVCDSKYGKIIYRYRPRPKNKQL